MLTVGTEIAGYRIDGILGRGGMGVVYEATQLSLDRKVALKLIVPELGQDDSLRERFRREGLRQAAIDHPNIVTVHEAGETEEGLFFAMRLVRGPTLKDLITARELDPRRTLRLLTPVADALDVAHEAGMIHRDIKPQNILVGSRDHPYLADFGLTKAVGDHSLTRSGQFVGTLDYVSPEQIQGEPVSRRSDVYSLAAVLYECLTGVVPYPRDSEAAKLYAHLSVPPPAVSEQRPDLPARLDDIVARAMAKNPDERYGSAGELLEAAEAALSGAGRAAETRPAALVRPDGSAVSPPPGTAETAPSAAALAGTATSTAPAAPTAPAGSTKSTREAGSTSARVPARPVGAPAGRRARILGLAAAAAVILGTAAYLLGASGGEEARAAPATAGPLRMELPPNWRRTPTIPSIPGLSLRDAANFAPAGGESGSLLAGTSDAEGPTLLPDGFERRLGEAPDREDVVEVGDVQAYRYRNLAMRGLGLPATVFVAPLPNRVATIVCLGAAEADTTRECEGAASTLELVDTDALPLGARDDYARPLNRLLGRLDTRRRSGRRELREAETPGAQAAAATGIANAYGDAGRAARRLPAGPAERPATRGLATSLDSAGAAYRGLAAAARSGDAAAYASGLDAVRARERALSQALDELGRLGYRVR